MNLAQERIGTFGKNNFGSQMEVIEYNNCSNILVKFEKGKPVRTSWQAFCKGDVKNPYDKTVYGIGYIGDGKYKPSINRKDTHQYKTWSSMLKRCYSEKFKEKNPAYIECTVSTEWHNYQNFASWYDQNYYKIDREVICLDKDIIVKGNKTYSPENCIFVPEFINKLFIKNESKRRILPIGVHLRKDAIEYPYRVIIGKDTNLGQYKTLEEAFQVYKSFKEKLIKTTANDYRDKIPTKLYESMINYQIEITD